MRIPKYSIHISLLVLVVFVHLSSSVKFSTNSICLRPETSNLSNKLRCEVKTSAIFVTLVQYTNDYANECGNSSKSLSTNEPDLKCVAYPTQSLSESCNGKQECLVKLDQPEFKFGIMGANCNFVSKILTINYECIPGKCQVHNVLK